MKHFWKQFVGWVSYLRSDVYSWTRIQLTIIYFFSTVAVVLLFQVFFSYDYIHYLRAFSESQGVSSAKIAQRVDRAHRVFLKSLLTLDPSDVLTIFITVGIGYALSGIVLQSLKKMIERQQRFLSDASHELKTPLTILKTEMEVFLQKNPREAGTHKRLVRKRSSVKSNLAEIDRMISIVESLLFMERIDSKQEVFVTTTVNIVSLLAEVIHSLRLYARKKQVKLILVPSYPVLTDVDIDKMRRAFTNVLRNAIDYSKPSGGAVNIEVKESSFQIEIKVTDHGIGIAAADLPLIFDPFYRGERVLAHHRQGTGLGLAIVKKIVEYNKGKIQIESRVDDHTTVSIFLPHSSS